MFLFWKCVQNDKWEITSFPRLEKSAMFRYVWQVKIETRCPGSVKSNYFTTARCHNLIVNVDYIMKAINIEKWSTGNCSQNSQHFCLLFSMEIDNLVNKNMKFRAGSTWAGTTWAGSTWGRYDLKPLRWPYGNYTRPYHHKTFEHEFRSHIPVISHL